LVLPGTLLRAAFAFAVWLATDGKRILPPRTIGIGKWLARRLLFAPAMLYHITARALGRLEPFALFAAAAATWRRLRAAFPDALAAILMPTHLHLLLEAVDPAGVRRRVGGLLGGLTRTGLCGPVRRVWEPVPALQVVQDPLHLRRQVRYLALNPCRAKLCRDPLIWLWSTHRDVVGAVADPWVPAARLAAALRVEQDGFAEAFHAYVSGDPTVNVAGTPPPRPAPARVAPVVPLEAVAVAAAAALRLPPTAVATRADARRLFVHLARHQGWVDTHLLAERCGLTTWQVRHAARQPEPGLLAARMCLGDARLVARSILREITARA
jgi:hypothetical protein